MAVMHHPFLDGGPAPAPVGSTDLDLTPFSRGKVRDMYDLGDRLLMVTSDRISAFDVVMDSLIPGKGIVLTALSAFWLGRTTDVVENHLLSTSVAEALPDLARVHPELEGRSMVVRKTRRVDIEAVVRGYLAGSGWAEYRKAGTLAGEPLPAAMQESDRLPEPRFTPSTKEDTGHDINISIAKMANRVGQELTDLVMNASLQLYAHAEAYGRERGIIIADTKFEFGLLDGRLILIDEVLTPDSSRFWPLDQYQPGGAQPSFDKQYLRDYLETLTWNKEPPPPPLPEDVVRTTSDKYREAYQRLAQG